MHPGMSPEEQDDQANKEREVLEALREGPLTTDDLTTGRFGTAGTSRVRDLRRKHGYKISCTKVPGGKYEYRLIQRTITRPKEQS
jgi:hypothetical protein